jgi:phosphoglycolate phosphatase-like HAD superfamily hydrolase
MALTRFLGVNIPLISLFLYSGHEITIPSARQNIALNRCLKNLGEMDNFEFVIWDLDDTILRKDGKPDPEAVASLIDLNNRNKKQILLTKNRLGHKLIQFHHIPEVFEEIRITEDKQSELGNILDKFGLDESSCILVNDAYSEILSFQQKYPSMRMITPDVLELLGREKIG